MASQAPSIYELLGHYMQGDLGGFTCYTSKRNRVVWFVKSPPLEPASPTQRTIRNIFVSNAMIWRAFSSKQKATWNRAAIAARLRIHGYDLYTWWMRTRNDGVLRTIERHTNIAIHRPQVEDN